MHIRCIMFSKRAAHSQTFENFKGQWAGLVRGNLYDAQTNPKGVVDMGTAENKLVEGIIAEKLSEPIFNQLQPYMQYYFEEHGIKREALASFLTERLEANQPITADNMIVTSGCGAALDLLSHILADPGDVFLCPSPFYPMISPDFGLRSQARVVPVPLTSADNYDLTVEKLEAVYKANEREEQVIKGLILLNPNNPLGCIYSQHQLKEILEWAESRKIHVIVDEIYAMSVFNVEAKFTSVSAMMKLPDPEKTHIVWGFSKDFSLSGFRAGVIVSWNEDLLNIIKPLIYYAAVPAIIQHKLKCMILDKEWLDEVYFKSSMTMLRDAYAFCRDQLVDMGVGVLEPKAGVFLWANFSKFINPLTMEAQNNLFVKFMDAGVYIEPAEAFFSDEVGWFRIVFAYKREQVEEGFKRMRAVLTSL